MANEARVLSGRYRVDELIGRGGMATVYRGYDLTLGRAVAIKVLRRDLARDSTFRTRFRLEAQAASRMANPTIVRVYDAGEDSETDADGGTPLGLGARGDRHEGWSGIVRNRALACLRSPRYRQIA